MYITTFETQTEDKKKVIKSKNKKISKKGATVIEEILSDTEKETVPHIEEVSDVKIEEITDEPGKFYYINKLVCYKNVKLVWKIV